jgi:uncharacterized protein (TIGR02271 family)
MTPPMQEHGDDARTLPLVMDVEHQVARLVSIDESAGQACLRTRHGKDIVLPTDLLRQNADGSYGLIVALSSVSEKSCQSSPGPAVIALHEETLKVDRRKRDTGKGIRVLKTVEHTEQVVDEDLETETFKVERIPHSEFVSEAPPNRHEGDTLIIPVLEEVLVVQKRLRIKEEIHITRQRGTTHDPQTFTLRSEHVVTERFDDSAAPDKAGS